VSRTQWITQAIEGLEREAALVRVVIAATRGSTPREAGTSMLVGRNAQWGSIGGGRLEWEALSAARALLDAGATQPGATLREWILGPELGQCCGGRVTLWSERLSRTSVPSLKALSLTLRNAGALRVTTTLEAGALRRDVAPLRTAIAQIRHAAEGPRSVLTETLVDDVQPLLLFGAGHVGQAIVRVLQEVPGFNLHWLDTRGLQPGQDDAGPRHRQVDDPVAAITAAPPGALLLVMTHDHSIDYDLCRAALRQGDAAWLGLIASQSKAARFRSRLSREGLGAASERLLCAPIGLPGIDGKAPGVIAVSVVAQLLALVQARRAAQPTPRGAIDGCGTSDCTGCRPALREGRP
jgi:xanthine dehydrogenase accessory factor